MNRYLKPRRIAQSCITASIVAGGALLGTGAVMANPYPPVPTIPPIVIVFPPIVVNPPPIIVDPGGGGHGHHNPPPQAVFNPIARPLPATVRAGGYPLQSKTGQEFRIDARLPLLVGASLMALGFAARLTQTARRATALA